MNAFVRFMGWFTHENIEYFGLEYVEFGDLEFNLKKKEKNRRKTLKKKSENEKRKPGKT